MNGLLRSVYTERDSERRQAAFCINRPLQWIEI